MKSTVAKLDKCFKRLTFNEELHKYYVDGEPLKYSVSGLIKKFYEPFDEDKMAPFSARKADVTAEEIKRQWKEKRDEACDRGTKVHLFGEEYVWDRTLIPELPQEKAAVKFWDSLPDHIVPVKMEQTMYHKKYLFGGTADILLYDKIKCGYIIADYKTNGDLFKNYKEKKLLWKFDNLLDCPLSHYVLQLSYYQILFEQAGLNILSRKVVWLQLDGTFKTYSTDDVTKLLKKHLKYNPL